MPWTVKDAHRFKRGLTPDQAQAWTVIANAAREEYGDEGRAIRTANSQASRMHRENGHDAARRTAVANAKRAKRGK